MFESRHLLSAAVAQLVRAPSFQVGCRQFESGLPLSARRVERLGGFCYVRSMRLTVVAHTIVTTMPGEVRGTQFGERDDWDDPNQTKDLDLLAELTGRGCYKSWSLPNPATAENDGYLANILDHGHYSVFEHGSVTFYVEDVSRALLLELERHRFTSYSVESQRYVDTRKHHDRPVIPPALEDFPNLVDSLDQHYESALALYGEAYNALRDAGLSVKEAREASRAFLLESTPVDFFVTGNIRAWRDVMGKRWSTHADREIQRFAGEILGELKGLAPASMQDFTNEPAD